MRRSPTTRRTMFSSVSVPLSLCQQISQQQKKKPLPHTEGAVEECCHIYLPFLPRKEKESERARGSYQHILTGNCVSTRKRFESQVSLPRRMEWRGRESHLLDIRTKCTPHNFIDVTSHPSKRMSYRSQPGRGEETRIVGDWGSVVI